jgi:hypothetical protein
METSLRLLIFENDVNVASKSNKQKTWKKFFSFHIEKVTDENAGSGAGSVSKCQGSATLIANIVGNQKKTRFAGFMFCYLQLGLHLIAEAQGIELNLKPVVEVLQKHNIN